MDKRICTVCGTAFTRRPKERQSVFARRKRCGFYCRPVSNPDKVGRDRAARLFPAEQPCEVCGKAGRGRGIIDRHHRSSDRLDNSPENIAFLCRKHHHAAHRASDGKVGGGPRPRIAALFRDQAVERSKDARVFRSSGLSFAEIGLKMGAHPESVRRWLRKYPE